MKLSIVFALCAATSVSAGDGGIRKRDLASAGGSISVPTCFSEVSSVHVFGKGSVDMKNLQVGDRIFTGETYQPVYAFAHRDTTTETDFVQIQMDQRNTLEATGGHLVYVDGKSGPVRVDSIEVGDVLQGAVVTKIGSVQRAGLYAPLTLDGKLIVDGAKASNYVSLEQVDGHALLRHNIQFFSHLGISPFRLLCTGVSSNICESYNDDGIPTVLSSIHQTFDWIMGLPVIFQALAIAIYLVIAAMAWTMECLLLKSGACFVLLAGTGAFATTKAMGIRIQADKIKTV